MKRLVALAVILGGLAYLGWSIYQKSLTVDQGGPRQKGNPAVAVEVVPVAKAAIRDLGRFSGSVNPISNIILAPKIGGRLEQIKVNIGDRVESGQLVAVLEDDEYTQQISQAEAEVEVARANLQERRNVLDTAKREYERTVALRAKKIASESQLDAADSEYKAQQAKLKVALAQLTQKETALNMANLRLAYTRVRVTEDKEAVLRVVGERFVDEGAMLTPNAPLVSIIDIGKLIVVINVIERDYSKIRPGLEAVITTDAFPDRTFTGRVVRIAPLLREKSREARVELEVPNKETLLKPGMFVRVEITFAEKPEAAVIPQSALLKREGKEGVFVADLGELKARFVPVKTGIVEGGRVEVLEPALSGPVITLGQHLIEDGSSIVLPGEKPGPGQGPKADPQADSQANPKPGQKPGAKPGDGSGRKNDK